MKVLAIDANFSSPLPRFVSLVNPPWVMACPTGSRDLGIRSRVLDECEWRAVVGPVGSREAG